MSRVLITGGGFVNTLLVKTIGSCGVSPVVPKVYCAACNGDRAPSGPPERA